MLIADAVERLHDRLPLRDRQRRLDDDLRAMHRAILHGFAETGRPPSNESLATLLRDGDVAAALARLGADDLIVLGADSIEVLGAYPMTLESTPHRLQIGEHAVYAMCALDAVSVSPMFGVDAEIHSRCHVSGDAVYLKQRGHEFLEIRPSADVRFGIRWQQPTCTAAHSMCREMVFLRDEATANQWQGGDPDGVELFTLPEAVEFGAAFFVPLVRG
jgi:mercuric reductase